jgi:hypothetical protein
MKDYVRKGILASAVLKNADYGYNDGYTEQLLETKPSRINRHVEKPKEKQYDKPKRRFDDYDD